MALYLGNVFRAAILGTYTRSGVLTHGNVNQVPEQLPGSFKGIQSCGELSPESRLGRWRLGEVLAGIAAAYGGHGVIPGLLMRSPVAHITGYCSLDHDMCSSMLPKAQEPTMQVAGFPLTGGFLCSVFRDTKHSRSPRLPLWLKTAQKPYT